MARQDTRRIRTGPDWKIIRSKRLAGLACEILRRATGELVWIESKDNCHRIYRANVNGKVVRG